jgi:hypothetical protein
MANSLKSLPKLPSLPKLAKKLNSCECGCGGFTGNRFVPGHDSRLKGWQIRITRTDADGNTLVQWEDIPDGERQAVAKSLNRTAEMVERMQWLDDQREIARMEEEGNVA